MIVMLSSGEFRFDYGLIAILKALFNEALLIEIEKKEHPSNGMTSEEKRELLLKLDREGKIKLPDEKVTELIREELIEKEGLE